MYFPLYKSYYSILHILHQWQRTSFANMPFAPRKQYTYAPQTIRSDIKNNMLMNSKLSDC